MAIFTNLDQISGNDDELRGAYISSQAGPITWQSEQPTKGLLRMPAESTGEQAEFSFSVHSCWSSHTLNNSHQTKKWRNFF